MRKQPDFESPDLKHNAMEGIEESLYWHTVGIVADSGAGLGTSVAVVWNNHRILLTARHVVQTTIDDHLRFFFRPSGTLLRGEWGEVPPDKLRVSPPARIEIFQRFENADLDIAALFVSPELEHSVNVRFHNLGEAPKLPRPIPPSVAAIGYAADSQTELAPNASAIAAVRLWGNLDQGRGWRPDDFRPRSQLLLEFLPAQFGRHPGGFSGAGIWYHKPTPAPGVWSPNLAMAGICTHYFPRRHRLLILRVERIVAFLSKIAPGGLPKNAALPKNRDSSDRATH